MKNVLITGISRGMGAIIAKRFISEGWNVIGTSTSGETSLLHDRLHVYQLDMTDPKSIQRFAEDVEKSRDCIDALINNAGIYLEEDSEKISLSALRKTLEVNLLGLIDLTERIIPLMNDGSSIVNTSSGMGSLVNISGSDMPAYRISKVGVNVYTRMLAMRLEGRITVSSFDPGWVRTDMGGTYAPRDPKEPAEEMFDLVTKKRDSGYFWYLGKKRSW